MPTDGQPIDTLMEGYRAAIDAKDVDAFVALYDERVRVFDLWGRWSYNGAGEWRGMVAEWFASLGDERVAVEWHDVTSAVAGDMALMHGFVTFRGMSAEGAELRAMTNRVTWGLRRNRAGQWNIIHEHTSAPADPETSKVVLRR